MMECGKSDLAGDHGCPLPSEVRHSEHQPRGWHRVGRQCAIGCQSFEVRADVRGVNLPQTSVTTSFCVNGVLGSDCGQGLPVA